MSSQMCRSASRRLIIVFGEAASLHASLICVSSASSGRSSEDRFRRGRLRDGPKPSQRLQALNSQISRCCSVSTAAIHNPRVVYPAANASSRCSSKHQARRLSTSRCGTGEFAEYGLSQTCRSGTPAPAKGQGSGGNKCQARR
jgi:hypothetical protein